MPARRFRQFLYEQYFQLFTSGPVQSTIGKPNIGRLTPAGKEQTRERVP